MWLIRFNLENTLTQLSVENACDSLAALDLTITQPDTSFIEVIACRKLRMEWRNIF